MELIHHCAIIGVTQTGKSTTALRLLQQQEGIKFFVNTKRETKWFLDDSNSEFACVKYEVKHPSDMMMVYRNYEAYSDHIIQYVPEATNKYAIEDLSKILDVILEQQQDNPYFKTTVLVDEIHNYQSTHSCNATLGRLWMMGLGIGIRSILISQLPTLCNKILLANSEIFILHATNKADIHYLTKEKGYITVPEGFDLDFPPSKNKPFIPHTSYIQTDKVNGLRLLEGEWNE